VEARLLLSDDISSERASLETCRLNGLYVVIAGAVGRICACLARGGDLLYQGFSLWRWHSPLRCYPHPLLALAVTARRCVGMAPCGACWRGNSGGAVASRHR